MSRTAHHNAPKRGKLFKLPDRHVGWFGEFLYTQIGRRFRKRTEHRAFRRWHQKEAMQAAEDALFGKDVPLPFERQDVAPAHVPLPPVKWKRAHLNRSV